jgi:preprotein translocase subunit YajC
MLSALAKGDKVTSIGGICGTVVEVRDDELVVKVDENNNMRLRFARWAIRGAGDQAKSQGPEDGR